DLIVVFLLKKYNYIKNKDDFFNIFTNSEDDKTKRDALYKILYETD
ncbi:XRE family transcriptional regulator, partial [Staphylococcus aureus]